MLAEPMASSSSSKSHKHGTFGVQKHREYSHRVLLNVRLYQDGIGAIDFSVALPFPSPMFEK